MFNRIFMGALWVVLLLMFPAVSQGTAAAAASAAVPVVVSILPQKYFVERVGGDRVAVSVMVPPGANPAVYEPKPRQMAELSRAVCYFTVGVPFERAWVPRFQAVNRAMRVVDTGAGIARRRMAAHHHDEGAAVESAANGHDAVILDPHIWLSPPLVLLQARNIWQALCAADPAHAAVYAANYRAFVREIAELDIKISATLEPLRTNRSFMVFHPAWGYFAEAYGLEQWPVELEGKEPKAAELQQIIERAKAHRVRVIFVQPEFSTRSAKTIADAIGAKLVPLDPLAESWPDNLMRAAESIRAALMPAS